MPRPYSAQQDLCPPGSTTTKYTPRRLLFDSTHIPRSGPQLLKEEPLLLARSLITKVLHALETKSEKRVTDLWRYTTGLDTQRRQTLPSFTDMAIHTCKFMIYIFLKTLTHIIYNILRPNNPTIRKENKPPARDCKISPKIPHLLGEIPQEPDRLPPSSNRCWQCMCPPLTLLGTLHQPPLTKTRYSTI